jgi:hypothetical protein
MLYTELFRKSRPNHIAREKETSRKLKSVEGQSECGSGMNVCLDALRHLASTGNTASHCPLHRISETSDTTSIDLTGLRGQGNVFAKQRTMRNTEYDKMKRHKRMQRKTMRTAHEHLSQVALDVILYLKRLLTWRWYPYWLIRPIFYHRFRQCHRHHRRHLPN